MPAASRPSIKPEELRQLRSARGISLTQLAKLTGLSASYLHHLEHGRIQRPGPEKLDRILLALSQRVARRPDEPSAAIFDVPKGLQDLALERGSQLTPADVQMLARIRVKGQQPATREDWRLLWNVLQYIVLRRR